MSAARFVLTPRGDFSLAKAIRFLQSFAPLSGRDGDEPDEVLRLVFCADGDWAPVAIRVRQSVAGRVTVTVDGLADPERLRAQVERMLSLDVDASALPDVVAHDAVAAALVQQFRGLRPVCFASPYEAACWAVLSQRIRMSQAAGIRRRMCVELGRGFDARRRATVDVPGARAAARDGVDPGASAGEGRAPARDRGSGRRRPPRRGAPARRGTAAGACRPAATAGDRAVRRGARADPRRGRAGPLRSQRAATARGDGRGLRRSARRRRRPRGDRGALEPVPQLGRVALSRTRRLRRWVTRAGPPNSASRSACGGSTSTGSHVT